MSPQSTLWPSLVATPRSERLELCRVFLTPGSSSWEETFVKIDKSFRKKVFQIRVILTSKNLWLADLINASVLSKSIVTYPFAFVPAAHTYIDSNFQFPQWKQLCSKCSTPDTYCWRACKICLVGGGGQFGPRCCRWNLNECWKLNMKSVNCEIMPNSNEPVLSRSSCM